MSESEEIEELWREIRILQLQVAMLTGLLHRGDLLRRPGKNNSDALRLILDRNFLETAERLDREEGQA